MLTSRMLQDMGLAIPLVDKRLLGERLNLQLLPFAHRLKDLHRAATEAGVNHTPCDACGINACFVE